MIPFITATHAIGYPGPLLAKFSDFWLVRQAQKGKRFVAVHELHQKHGESKQSAKWACMCGC